MKLMIDKRKPIENRRSYTAQSKNGIHFKRKKDLKCQNKRWPDVTGVAFGSRGLCGWLGL